MIAEWFINYELPLAISLISSIPLIGSFLCGAIIPRVYTSSGENLGDAFYVGFISCLLSFILVIALTLLDYRT